MFVKALRKFNTKIAIRLMMVFISVASIIGSFHLFKLFQNELLTISNYSVSTLIRNLIFGYFIPLFLATFVIFFVLKVGLIEQGKIKLRSFKKSLLSAVFITLLVPGFMIFPEAYGLNTAILTLPMFLFLIFIFLARFLQKYTDEQIGIMKSELKDFIHVVRGR